MSGGKKPEFRKLAEGERLVTQGQAGDEIFLLLDGVLAVEIDNEPVAEVGPGAVLGEMAALEGGLRTATLIATTPVRVAVSGVGDLKPEALRELAGRRRQEETS